LKLSVNSTIFGKNQKRLDKIGVIRLVAPRAGAWIETIMSRNYNNLISQVAPRAGAWIETVLALADFEGDMSHPVRVRGLKQPNKNFPFDIQRRTPCGCVD